MDDDSAKNSFLKRVNKTDGCWFWTLHLDRDGYGRFRGFLAHRFSWILEFGRIPKGLCVLHRCDNGACVNPGHLFLGTKKDNTIDMIKKGRGSNGVNKGQETKKRKKKELLARYAARFRLFPSKK